MMRTMRMLLLVLLLVCMGTAAAQDPWETAAVCGEQARKALLACWRYSQGWLQHADPASGLIPRNLQGDPEPLWNAKDAAADNYPFMVLTAYFTDRGLFEGRMKRMLETEQRLCNRIDRLPHDWLFGTQSLPTEKPDLANIIFQASEYAKDGLIPVTEWLGPSPWSERMLGLVDDIWKHATIDTEVGRLPSTSHEVAGELMQTLSRLYWMTGNERYRERAFQLADYFLVHHSLIREDVLRLNDHGCEVIGGLSEVYFLAAHTNPGKRAQWKAAIHRILDRVLEVGRNEYGLFYHTVNPVTGEILRDDLTDNWGYNYNAFLVVADLDDVPRYRAAVEHVLTNLLHSKDYPWERASADGYADSLEGCLNLVNRMPVPEAMEWADYTAAKMLAIQRDTGVVEGWHGDGNFARTALMYALWKSQGAYLEPWRADLRLGAARGTDGATCFVVQSDWPWRGKLRFDIPRHAEYLHLPVDYPRLNQFPEWFTVSPGGEYQKDEDGVMSATELRAGLSVDVSPQKPFRLRLKHVK